MIKQLEQIEEFMDAYSIPKIEMGDVRLIPLFEEEFKEYIQAVVTGDRVEVADALQDMMVYLLQMMKGYGFTTEQMIACFDEVHASNMSKSCVCMGDALKSQKILRMQGIDTYIEQSSDAKRYIIRRVEDDKIMKGVDYFKPDLKSIIDV